MNSLAPTSDSVDLFEPDLKFASKRALEVPTDEIKSQIKQNEKEMEATKERHEIAKKFNFMKEAGHTLTDQEESYMYLHWCQFDSPESPFRVKIEIFEKELSSRSIISRITRSDGYDIFKDMLKLAIAGIGIVFAAVVVAGIWSNW